MKNLSHTLHDKFTLDWGGKATWSISYLHGKTIKSTRKKADETLRQIPRWYTSLLSQNSQLNFYHCQTSGDYTYTKQTAEWNLW